MFRQLQLSTGVGLSVRLLPKSKSLWAITAFLLFSFPIFSQIDISFNITEPVCFGLPNGSVTATASNGTGPYTYVWSTGDFGPTLNNITAGSYTVTVTDDNGDMASEGIIVGQPDQLLVDLVANICSAPFSVTAFPSGGQGPYGYSWSTGSNAQTINNLPSGTYCVTVTDSELCGVVDCITLDAIPLSISVVATGVTCPDGMDGQVQATPNGGTPPYSLEWNTGQTGPLLQNLAPGSYTVTVTDVNGCMASATGVVSDQAPIIISLNPTDPTCLGDTNGSISASASGGTPPFTYSWNTGASGQVIANLGPGTYSVTVTDANGCEEEAATTLAPLSSLTIGALGTNETCPDANDGFATVTTNNGVLPYTYIWSNGGNTQVLTDLPPGTYSVTVIDAVGCSATATTSVAAAPNFDIMVTASMTSSCGIPDGVATATVVTGIGPYSYLWSTGATTPSISNLAAGTYFVTVTGNNGCEANGSATVVEPPAVAVDINATDLVCAGEANGIAQAIATGGTPPYTYLWNTGSTDPQLINLPAGPYSVVVTDAIGCTDIADVMIQEAPGLSVSVSGTEIVCGAGNTGTAMATVIGGTGPFSFFWSTGSTQPSIDGLGSGTYTLVVVDDNGCVANGEITIQVIDDLAVTITDQDNLCFGDFTGSATANGSGGTAPYEYEWDTGATTQTISNLPAGIYTVTLTDVNECEVEETIIISQPSELTVTIDATALLCFGESDGTLTALPVGGTPAYAYIWNTGDMTQTINNAPAGTYSVTVTDANLCEATATITVQQAPELVLEIEGTEIVCGAESNGDAMVNANGGTPPYTYMWSTGDTEESIDGLGEGTFGVTVTDALGCTATTEIEIDLIDDFMLNITPRDLLCNGDNSGSILILPQGGTEPYTYQWSTGGDTNEITGLTAGQYTVTVTDANGCEISETISVNEPPVLEISVSSIDVECFGDSNGSATVTVNGGMPPYTIEWSDNQMGLEATDLAPGTYTVTVTDANDCTEIASVTINEPDELTVNVSAPTIDCAGTSSGSLNPIIAGGTEPYSYQWSTGDSSPTLENLPAGMYSLTVTDANGCAATAETITLSELPELEITFEVTDIACTDQAVGAIAASVSGGTGPYTFLWSNNAITDAISNLTAGTYFLTVTDANGCEVMGSATVDQFPGLQVMITSTDVSCLGNTDGSALVAVNGGTAPFTYDWSNGADTPQIDNLSPGTYTVTVTGSLGCMGEASVTIGEPSAITIDLTGTNVSCLGYFDGAVNSTVNGGTSPYTYEWNTGATTASISDISAGDYSLTVTDANGCQASSSITITEPDALLVEVMLLNGTCANDQAGVLTAVVTGGTMPYDYSWSNGENTETITGLGGGTYIVVVMDANGCMRQAMLTLTAYEVPSCTVNVLQEVVNGNDGELEVVASGGQAPYSYLWSNGENTSVISNLAGGVYSVTVTDENGCETVCQNELIPLSGLGDYVWEDADKDGIQDDNESGIEGVTVKLKDEQGNVIDMTTTDANGFYSFVGLQPGTYSVMFIAPDGFTYTQINIGDDASDSDANFASNEMTQNTTLDPGEFDPTLDAGFYLSPTITTDDPCVCLNNSTTEDNGQFSEQVTIFSSYSDENWTIIDQSGLFLVTSLEPPAVPISAPIGLAFVETSPGIYQIDFRLVDEVPYTILVTDGIDTLSLSNICEYPTVNVAEIPPLNFCVYDNPIDLVATPSIPGTLTFYLDGVPVTTLDPEEMGLGDYVLNVIFIPSDPNECEVSLLHEFTIDNSCAAKIGDQVWFDIDRDGLQDPNEPGIPGVKVTVSGVEEDDDPYMDMTFTDATGMYMFWVPPGTYKVTFEHPDGLIPTTLNEGADDTIDSDADPDMGLMTHTTFVDDGEMDLTLDAGFYAKCDNINNPGVIAGNQFLCGPGVDPDPITSAEDPSGGSGEMEYLWMMSNVPGPFDVNVWLPIPNSNSASFDPGPVFETTYFARCARRECCTTYLESNIVTIEVGSVAVADIQGPSLVCEDEPITFYAVGNGPDAVIEWNFGPGVIPATATGSPVTVTFSSFGSFEINLMVTENDCTSQNFKDITVTNNPVECGNALTIDVHITDEDAVMVTWETQYLGDDYAFDVEHSTDGENFAKISQVTEPELVIGGMEFYQYLDVNPKLGRNYYRVKVVAPTGDYVYSEVEEAVILGESKLMLAYPNPMVDQLVLEIFDTFNEDVTLTLVAANGVLLRKELLPADTKRKVIDVENLPAGVYFLQVTYGKTDIKTLRLLKQ